MTVTHSPVVPPPAAPPARTHRRRAVRTTGVVLVGGVTSLAVAFVVVRVAAQLLGFWSPAPDTDAFDSLVRHAGLQETVRHEQSGSPAFGIASSVSMDVDAARGDGDQACVALYRAAARTGWTSEHGVTAATCTDRVGDLRTDTLDGPHGRRVALTWTPPYAWVGVEIDGPAGPR